MHDFFHIYLNSERYLAYWCNSLSLHSLHFHYIITFDRFGSNKSSIDLLTCQYEFVSIDVHHYYAPLFMVLSDFLFQFFNIKWTVENRITSKIGAIYNLYIFRISRIYWVHAVQYTFIFEVNIKYISCFMSCGNIETIVDMILSFRTPILWSKWR